MTAASQPQQLITALWQTLHAARGNAQIRERLVDLVGDPIQLEALVRQVGPSHAVVRDLLEMARASSDRPALVSDMR